MRSVNRRTFLRATGGLVAVGGFSGILLGDSASVFNANQTPSSMQSMPMMHMGHNTFWLEDQIIVTFHSAIPFISADGVTNGPRILNALDLEAQLRSLNQFLKEQKINQTLSFLQEEVTLPELYMAQENSPSIKSQTTSFTPPAGVHLFGLSKPIQSPFGVINTSIVTFCNFSNENTNENKIQYAEVAPSPVVDLVNQLNTGLKTLNMQFHVPIGSASPHFLCGGTGAFSQGCPLTPPIPIEENRTLWHFQFPKLTPDELQKMTGEGVTIFILDTLPEPTVIKEAAQKAGNNNPLLVDVSNNVQFNYNFPMKPLFIPKPTGGLDRVGVGKDVYGRHFPMILPDHGLFIAGIVRDIAPDATIECIRVLNEYCVGEMQVLTQALESIHNRMLPGNDLYQRPVVINLSLVIPTPDELKAQGIILDLSSSHNNVYTPLLQKIQSLVGLGALIVTSAGNEGDLRANSAGLRPGALYPAAFANLPDSLEGIIPVGAVDSNGRATSYSCYPGPQGIATYGGELPEVTPKNPDPNHPPVVTVKDAVRGIYSSANYPPLLAYHPQTSTPNDHAWAYWVGTSFATPIISALAARVLEWKLKGGSASNVRDAIIAAAGTNTTNWDRLDPATGITSGTTDGPVILTTQYREVIDLNEFI